MDTIMSGVQRVFPSVCEICLTKEVIFEAVIVRDYRLIVALLISFVASSVLVVCDLYYCWSYEKRRRQIILLPAETQQREQGCGNARSSQEVQEIPAPEERVEELFVARTPSVPSSASSARSRRHRPNRPFAADLHKDEPRPATVGSSVQTNADKSSSNNDNN